MLGSGWSRKACGVVLLCAGALGCPSADPEPGAHPSSTPAASPAPADPEEGAVIQIEQTFTGWVSMGMPGPGADVPASGTRVIQSAEEFQSFVSAIPTKRIQKRQPAPPSNDPLLKDPQLDFSTHTMIVIERSSMYIGPEIERVEAKGTGAHVLYRLPPLGETVYAAAVMDMGTYVAILVPKLEGEVSFELAPNPPEGE